MAKVTKHAVRLDDWHIRITEQGDAELVLGCVREDLLALLASVLEGDAKYVAVSLPLAGFTKEFLPVRRITRQTHAKLPPPKRRELVN